MTKRKRTNNDPQHTTHKTKDWATRTSQENRDELRSSASVINLKHEGRLFDDIAIVKIIIVNGK